MRAGGVIKGLGAGALALALLAGCATPRAPTPTLPVGPPAGPAPPPPAQLGGAIRPADLPGWSSEDHLAALHAYQAGCGAQKFASDTCRRARLLAASDAEGARRFLEESFRAEPVAGSGLLTAYFSPVYEARTQPDAEFNAAVLPTPADFTPGGVYADRTTIEQRPHPDALAWMRAEDLFFLQIQGSGTLVYTDGRKVKAAFAAHNGRTFAGIANPMRRQGLLAPDNTSGDAIRGWLASHRGAEAEAVMQLNPRYVFFRLSPDDDRDPAGAAGVPLPPGHAIAVDPAFNGMGQLFWIDASAPSLRGAFPAYQRLVVALDTGGAIKGEVRADLYTGRGDAAGQEAGRVRHSLRLYRLLPIDDVVR